LRWGLTKFLPGLALNHDISDLSIPSSYNYRGKSLIPGSLGSFIRTLIPPMTALPAWLNCFTKASSPNTNKNSDGEWGSGRREKGKTL
jgi:hypothetical protein